MGLANRVLKWLAGEPSIDREGVEFLTLRPTPLVDHEIDEQSGNVVLLVPRFRSGIFARFLQPRIRSERAFIRVKLEKRGTWIWPQCNGKKTVEDIVANFETQFPDDHEQARERIAQYLLSLERNRFLELTVPVD